MPLAPMGCTVLLHNKPDIREKWDIRAINGYCIETLHEHYRCYKVLVKNTRSVCLADNIFFQHKYITMPTINKADAIVAAATNLGQVLQNKIATNVEENFIKQLKGLVDMLQQTASNAMNDWAKQQSRGIINIHRQQRVAENLKEAPCQTTHSPTAHNNESLTRWTQKIVASTTEPTNVASPTEPHAPHPLPQALDQPVDSTRAKRMTWTITQEFAQL